MATMMKSAGASLGKAAPKVISRRNAISQLSMVGAVGVSKALFPAWMPRLAFRPARAKAAPGDVLVAIFLRGGWDALNVVVPFGEGRHYFDKRPTLAIREPDGSATSAINLDGFFGFHPALRPLKEVYDGGKLAVIHATGSPNPTRSHFDAMEVIERGTPMDKNTASGWINRHLQSAAWKNDSPFRAVGMGTMVPVSMRGPISALALKSITDFHLGGREDQLAAIQQSLASLYTVAAPTNMLTTQAADVFSTMDMIKQLAASGYTPASGVTYPETEFGLGLKQVAQLIKAEVGLEVACVDLGGWDTHESQGSVEGYLGTNLTEFANGLAAFYADLGAHLSDVTVMAMSEFGRRATENASGGTDHGHGSCMFLMGGGVKGGMYSKWPGLNDEALDDGDLAMTTDYRDVLSEVLTGRILNPAIDQIFPNYVPHPLGLITPR
jgi:uncharacterized protein (DUF1501 family)